VAVGAQETARATSEGSVDGESFSGSLESRLDDGSTQPMVGTDGREGRTTAERGNATQKKCVILAMKNMAIYYPVNKKKQLGINGEKCSLYFAKAKNYQNIDKEERIESGGGGQESGNMGLCKTQHQKEHEWIIECKKTTHK